MSDSVKPVVWFIQGMKSCSDRFEAFIEEFEDGEESDEARHGHPYSRSKRTKEEGSFWRLVGKVFVDNSSHVVMDEWR